MSDGFDLHICCMGAGYVGGPTMAVIAANCPKVGHSSFSPMLRWGVSAYCYHLSILFFICASIVHGGEMGGDDPPRDIKMMIRGRVMTSCIPSRSPRERACWGVFCAIPIFECHACVSSERLSRDQRLEFNVW